MPERENFERSVDTFCPGSFCVLITFTQRDFTE